MCHECRIGPNGVTFGRRCQEAAHVETAPPADPHDPYGSYKSYAPAGALKSAHFEG